MTKDAITVYGDHKLTWQGRTYACALGKGGIKLDKREGDGATPVGRFKLKRVLYRADRIDCPTTVLKTYEIGPTDGWCDAPTHPDYNTPITLPFEASHEELWRTDHIYDIIVIMGHNDDPPVPYKGSAVFFHLARAHFEGTEGCVAVTEEVMRKILKSVTPDTVMDIRL